MKPANVNKLLLLVFTAAFFLLLYDINRKYSTGKLIGAAIFSVGYILVIAGYINTSRKK